MKSRVVKDGRHRIRMYIMEAQNLYFPMIITCFSQGWNTTVYLHGGALNSSQDVRSRVRSGVVLCSCERSSSSRCPGFAQAVAWMAGDPTPVWTTLGHLYKSSAH